MKLCELQLNFIKDAFEEQQSWATDFYGFNSRFKTKFMHESIGHYDECVNFKYNATRRGIGIIRGQYCTLAQKSISDDLPDVYLPEWSGKVLEPTRESIFQSGICVPDTCTIAELPRLIGTLMKRTNIQSLNLLCQSDKPYPLYVLDYFILVILALLLTSMIASTVFDILKRKTQISDEIKKCYTSFSLYTNIKELFQVDYFKSKNVIYCMHGLRVLSIFWVIAAHRLQRKDLYMSLWDKPTNIFGIIILKVIYKVTYAVDVFFLLSSILVTHSCLRVFEKKNMNLPKFYLSRYLRYAPSMMVLVLFIISSFPMLLIDGPVIRYYQDIAWKCNKYWWSALFLIQNYTNIENPCLDHTWYLNTDFQLYLVSPFIIYAAWKLGFKSFWIFGSILAINQIFILYMKYNDTLTFLAVYRQMHFRIGQWLIGIALGYFMHRFKNDSNEIKISKKVQNLCWIVTSSAWISQEICYFLVKSKFYNEFYHATHRIIFTCFVGWLIFSFHYMKSGGMIRWFLSHPLWQPLSKLSLSIYLAHDVYIILSVSNTKELTHYEMSWFVHVCAGDILMSILYGTLLYILFEAPIAKVVNNYLK